MIEQKFADIFNPQLAEGAYINNLFPGFREDYLVLHCLLRMHNPESIFEVGTNVGTGINVMAQACPGALIFSLDLDYATMRQNSAQYPIGTNGEDRVGSAAVYPFTSLRGDSMKFDYSKYPCQAYFIDGEHDYIHPNHEAKEIIKLSPRLIIFHDADIPEIYEAILEAFTDQPYKLYRVTDTRIAYALKD